MLKIIAAVQNGYYIDEIIVENLPGSAFNFLFL